MAKVLISTVGMKLQHTRVQNSISKTSRWTSDRSRAFNGNGLVLSAVPFAKANVILNGDEFKAALARAGSVVEQEARHIR